MASEKRLIDAIRLKEVLERYVNAPHVRMGCSYSGGMSTAINTCISFLDNQPTVDAVEVVHARWELRLHDGLFVDHICSACGHMERLDIHLSPLERKHCPNCGAKMDGGNENV